MWMISFPNQCSPDGSPKPWIGHKDRKTIGQENILTRGADFTSDLPSVFGVNMKMDLNLRSHIYHSDGLRQSTEFISEILHSQS